MVSKKYFFFRNAQISIIEFPMLIMLFSLFIGGIYIIPNLAQNDFSNNIESFLDSVYYSDDFRENVILENLSKDSLDVDWSNLNLILSEVYGDGNYEIIISNLTYSKVIFSCNASLNKYYAERIISIFNNSNTDNNSIYDFRKIKLGVCY